MAAAIEIRVLEDGLWVIDKVAQLGRITAAKLGQSPGWNRGKANRYLHVLARTGYLEQIGSDRRHVYILGRKFLERSDLTFAGQAVRRTSQDETASY